MRYLVISPYFYPHIGGSQRYMEELYAHLIQQNPTTKVDVLCYNTDHAPVKESYRGMTIYRVGSFQPLPGQYAVANPFALIGLLIQLSVNTYDVVHTNTRFFESTIWAWAFARLIGARSILTDHVAHHPIHPNRTITNIAKFLDLTVIRWILTRYDAVTATNKNTRDFLTGTLNCSNVALLYGGVDTKYFAPGKSSKTRTIPHVRKRFSKNDVIVTFAGRLIKTKGVMLYIKAVQNIMKHISKRVYFVIAGSGPLENKIASELTTKTMKRHIVKTGALTPKEMRRLFQSTDIFVHPSFHSEGFPNALLEATASGCFTIATDNAGTKEIIQHNVTGLLIKQRDTRTIQRSLLWTLAHPKKRKMMSIAGRIRTKNRFDWKEQVDEFLSLVQTLYLSPQALRNLAKVG